MTVNISLLRQPLKHHARALSLTITLLTGACGSVPLGSLVQLSRIDARTTDVSALRVALRSPNEVRPRAQGVNMDVVVKISGEPEQKTTFYLAETHDPSDLVGLAPADQAAYSTYAFRLSLEDVARFEKLRKETLAKELNGKSVSIGMGVATKEFCRAGTTSSGPLLITTYLRTSETGTYVVVTKNLDLRQEPSIAGPVSKLEPC